MNEWRNTPIPIEQIPSGTKLALFIDESGQAKYKGTSENNRFFTLCGCLFEIEALKEAQQKILDLKSKYWEDGKFHYKSGHERVTFHMSEIANAQKGYPNRNNPFCCLGEKVSEFYEEYKNLISQLDFFVFSVTVDKLGMMQRYSAPYDPYSYALELLFERVSHCVTHFYPDSADSMIVILESTGPKEDGINHKHIMSILNTGTDYQSERSFRCVKGVYFCPKRSKNGKSYYGLEVADFCAYPIKLYFIRGYESDEFEIINPKIYRKGSNATSFGLKKVP